MGNGGGGRRGSPDPLLVLEGQGPHNPRPLPPYIRGCWGWWEWGPLLFFPSDSWGIIHHPPHRHSQPQHSIIGFVLRVPPPPLPFAVGWYCSIWQEGYLSTNVIETQYDYQKVRRPKADPPHPVW